MGRLLPMMKSWLLVIYQFIYQLNRSKCVTVVEVFQPSSLYSLPNTGHKTSLPPHSPGEWHLKYQLRRMS